MSDATITHAGGTIQAVLDEYRAAREAGTIVHPISNRENPDWTFRPFDLRTGEFLLAFGDAAAADAAFAALCTPQVLALASTARPGVGMSFIIADGGAPEIAPVSGATTIRVPFQEVSP